MYMGRPSKLPPPTVHLGEFRELGFVMLCCVDGMIIMSDMLCYNF